MERMATDGTPGFRKLVIEYVGGSDEERALLRLLLRSLAPRLRSTWIWGSADNADLLVVDPTVLVGEVARTRALESGVRCVVLSASPGGRSGDFVLPLPLRADDVLRVLDAASMALESGMRPVLGGGNAVDAGSGDESWKADFAAIGFDIDFDAPPPSPPPGADEAESLFRRDPSGERSSVLIPGSLGPEVGIDWSGDVTARSEMRAGGPRTADSPTRRQSAKGEPSHTLTEILEGGLLVGPSRIAESGLPELVLDPKARVYHCAAPLPALEPYFGRPIKLSAWVPLTGSDLTSARGKSAAQPYDRLRWLDVLLLSGGSLARRLDPGGVYRLRQWFPIAREYPRAYRISAALLRPTRLHEVAAATGLPMAEVFNVVNAWDALGFLEWQPRDRLRRDPQGGS
jgi:hypothetical protein